MVRDTDGHGKTSDRRPTLLTREAEDLQWDLFEGKISKIKYYVKRTILKANGKWWKK